MRKPEATRRAASDGTPGAGVPAAQDAAGGVADGTGVGDEAALPPQPENATTAAADTTPPAKPALMSTCLLPRSG